MITYELALLLGATSLIVFLIIAFIRKTGVKKILIISTFIAYLTAVVCITLFPIHTDEKVKYFGDIIWYNYIPFKTITGMLNEGLDKFSVVQITGNVLMTIPFGIFVMFMTDRKLLKIFFAVMFPVSIEMAQLIIGLIIGNMYRTVDIDDFILNFVGVLIGYAIYKVFKRCIKSK